MNSLEAPVYKYEGINRVILRSGDDNYSEETLLEFLIRMKEHKDIQWIDLDRAELEIPVFDNCKKDRRDLRAALEGIAAGGRMLIVTAKSGFASWGHFEACALGRSKTIKAFYLLAKEERKLRRLDDAEHALQVRSVDGVDEPIINHLGAVVGYKKKYSDRLLELNLKSLAPEVYSDRNTMDTHGLVVNVQMGLRDPEPQEAKEIVEVDFAGLGDVDLSTLQEDIQDSSILP